MWDGFMHGWRGYGGVGGMFGMFFMLLWWIVIIVVLVVAIRWAVGGFGPMGTAGPAQRPPEQSPVDVLKMRYARGEIDKEEYEAKKRDLEA